MYQREKKYRIGTLNDELYNITVITNNYLNSNQIRENGNYHMLDSLVKILPQKELRITIIDASGKVMYDSTVKNWEDMVNHKEQTGGDGINIFRFRHLMSENQIRPA